MKGKVSKKVVRPAVLFGLEMEAPTKRQEAEPELAELKMLKFTLEVTKMARFRKEHIRGTTQVGHLGDRLGEARLRWFGDV